MGVAALGSAIGSAVTSAQADDLKNQINDLVNPYSDTLARIKKILIDVKLMDFKELD